MKKVKKWSSNKVEEKATQSATMYSGKGGEYQLTGLTERYGRARPFVGDKGGAYRLWESKEQRIGSAGTYDGVFLDAPNVTFRDKEHRTVERERDGRSHATVVGNETLPVGDVSVFFLRVVETDFANNGISVGVAPNDIVTTPDHENREECGWYFNFYEEKLYSGPPQNARGKAYARRNDIDIGDVVRVTFDATGKKGVLSFAVNNEDFGVAFDDIPLDKPIVPAVYFYGRGECIELCPPDYEPPEDWNEDEEVGVGDGNFVRLPAGSAWKECPASVTDKNLCYSRPDSSNLRVAKKTDVSGSIYCNIIGDTPIPVGPASFWKVRIVKAFSSGGNEVFSGVAPTDIDQTVEKSYKSCGWYLRWGRGALYSGPPQRYHNRSYSDRQNACSGSIVGHILDTTSRKVGKLSFVVNNKDAGVAYDNIPLDKPLVPCVLLHWAGDSVELVL